MIKNNSPLIHCITNPISINQCANAILALGARPIMAEHPGEVKEITLSADALMLNLGNITDVRMKSMLISAKAAKKKHIPIVLDAVGVSCSVMRRNYAQKLIKHCSPTLIKGNYSEICALFDISYSSPGIDSDSSLDESTVESAAKALSKKYGCIVLASGKTDIVTNGNRLVCINGGTPQLAKITGTGCMLGAICACCLAVCPNIDAAITACNIMGSCGKLAECSDGSGSFSVRLADKLSTEVKMIEEF